MKKITISFLLIILCFNLYLPKALAFQGFEAELAIAKVITPDIPEDNLEPSLKPQVVLDTSSPFAVISYQEMRNKLTKEEKRKNENKNKNKKGRKKRKTEKGRKNNKGNRRFIYPVGKAGCFNGYHWYAIDCMRPIFTEIHASRPGRVIKAQGGWNGGYGNYVIIDHGDGWQTLYAHQVKLNVRVGEWVKRGQVIGWVGSTGNSLGCHLHFETRKNGRQYNPFLVLK